MRIDVLKDVLRERPEAAGSDSAAWASLRESFRESRRLLFEVPPDVRATLEMLRAAGDGDIARALALAEEFLGREPDLMLLDILESEFASARSVVPVVAGGLRYHQGRLETVSSRWYRERTEEVDRHLRKRPGQRLMQALRGHEESPLARLQRELPGAIAKAEADGVFGRGLPRAVEEIIVADSRRLGQTRKRVENQDGVLRERFVPLPEVLGDTTLDAYDGAENANAILDQIISRAGLTSRERQVLRLYRRSMKPKEIAARLGIARSTVYSLWRRARAALRAAA